MSFTYSNTSIGTNLAKVRLLIQDTVSATASFTDEEINAQLSLASDDVFSAAALCCETMGRAMLAMPAQTRLADGSASVRRSSSEWLAMAQAIRVAALSGSVQTGSIDVSTLNELLDSYRPEWRDINDLPVVE